MAPDRFPRGAQRLAEQALKGRVAEGADDWSLAGTALTAALPVIERAVLKDAAKRILLLPGLLSGSLCPDCHGRCVAWPGAPNPAYRAPRLRCKKGHEWDKPADAARAPTGDALLRMLARGEPLPDLPPKEEG